MSSPSIAEFAQAAEEFCLIAERQTQEPPGLYVLRALLLRLMYHMPAVARGVSDGDVEGADVDKESCLVALKRFSLLPFSFYRCVFDPHDLDAKDEPVMGLLSDDLADIYGDVAEGLSIYRTGNPGPACEQWSLSYRIHWVRHAVNALGAIEIYLADNWIREE